MTWKYRMYTRCDLWKKAEGEGGLIMHNTTNPPSSSMNIEPLSRPCQNTYLWTVAAKTKYFPPLNACSFIRFIPNRDLLGLMFIRIPSLLFFYDMYIRAWLWSLTHSISAITSTRIHVSWPFLSTNQPFLFYLSFLSPLDSLYLSFFLSSALAQPMFCAWEQMYSASGLLTFDRWSRDERWSALREKR